VESVIKARFVLEQFSRTSSKSPDRDDVVAYATLEAWVSHFPDFAETSDRELLKKTESIFLIEKDRFYKQRRIALSKLAK
jgi:hypothetical protein